MNEEEIENPESELAEARYIEDLSKEYRQKWIKSLEKDELVQLLNQKIYFPVGYEDLLKKRIETSKSNFPVIPKLLDKKFKRKELYNLNRNNTPPMDNYYYYFIETSEAFFEKKFNSDDTYLDWVLKSGFMPLIDKIVDDFVFDFDFDKFYGIPIPFFENSDKNELIINLKCSLPNYYYSELVTKKIEFKRSVVHDFYYIQDIRNHSYLYVRLDLLGLFESMGFAEIYHQVYEFTIAKRNHLKLLREYDYKYEEMEIKNQNNWYIDNAPFDDKPTYNEDDY